MYSLHPVHATHSGVYDLPPLESSFIYALRVPFLVKVDKRTKFVGGGGIFYDRESVSSIIEQNARSTGPAKPHNGD